jgi:hypothetical protein
MQCTTATTAFPLRNRETFAVVVCGMIQGASIIIIRPGLWDGVD